MPIFETQTLAKISTEVTQKSYMTHVFFKLSLQRKLNNSEILILNQSHMTSYFNKKGIKFKKRKKISALHNTINTFFIANKLPEYL